MLQFGGSVAWNSNVFSLPDSADPQAQLGTESKSDRIHSYYAGLRIDQFYWNQRFLLDATITAYRYRVFEHLDFDATQYSGAWQWRVTPRLTGTVSADRSESLVNYADFRQFDVRNVRVNESQAALADVWVDGAWHLVGGASARQSRTEIPVPGDSSFRAAGGEGGVKYVSAAGNSARLTLRRLDGNYLDRPADPVQRLGVGFERDETELVATWTASARSSLDARIARIDYKEDDFPERNFTGPALRLGWHWMPMGRVSFDVAAIRELSSWRDLTAKYKVDQRLSLGASWELGARSSLRASVSRGSIDYREPLVPLAIPERHDTARAASLGFDWRPLRNLTANASVSAQRQKSNLPNNDYKSAVLTLGASILF